jgi:predicted peptidase
MSSIPTKKRSKGKPALAATKKRLSLGNTGTSTRPHRKSRKNVSHQQTIQARDTLDAEYRDWRTGVSTIEYQIFAPYQVSLSPNYKPYCNFRL